MQPKTIQEQMDLEPIGSGKWKQEAENQNVRNRIIKTVEMMDL